MQEHPCSAHAYACRNTRPARGDTHTRAAYVYAAPPPRAPHASAPPALSHRDAHTDRDGYPYGNGNTYASAHRDTAPDSATYAAPNRNINTKPDPQAGYLKR